MSIKDTPTVAVETAGLEAAVDRARKTIDELRTQRDDLLQACIDLREALAAAMRVLVDDTARTKRWIAECHAIGLIDGFGVRAEAAIKQCSRSEALS